MCGLSMPKEHFACGNNRYRSMCRPCYKQVKSLEDKDRYQRHRERMFKERNERRKNNPAKHAAYVAAYKARKLQQTLRLTPEQKLEITQIYLRAAKLSQLTGIPHQVDHVHPLRHPLLCGLHVPWNLQVIPKKLNQKKSNSIPIDRLQRRELMCSHVDEA